MDNPVGHCLVLMAVLAIAGCAAHAEPVNIARGCPVTFGTPPNYDLCTDENDAKQLTDGEHCPDVGSMWAYKETVGWAGGSPIVFTIDLGKSRPISGVSYSTGAGVAGVTWPGSILALVSDDNKTWRLVGDLVRIATAQPPPLGQYARFTYVTHRLATRGRYVQLAVDVQTGPFIFVDEVEVYEGPESLPAAKPAGKLIIDARQYIRDNRVTQSIRDRLAADIAYVSRAMDESTIAEGSKKKLAERLAEAGRKAALIDGVIPSGFKAVLPLNELHADVFKVYSQVIRSKGFPAFFAWRKHRYDPLGHFEFPSQSPKSTEVSITMMRREFRSDSFLLTNASDKPMNARLSIKGLPRAPRPAWLQVSSVPWTDTSSLVPIAAALPNAPYSEGAYEIHIPAGMTGKVWLTVDSSKLEPGSYDGACLIEHAGGKLKIPFKLRVSSMAMGRPRLSLGMWDYTDAKEARGINDGNRLASIKLMRSHFVDSPWATSAALPWPKAEDFDSSNRLKPALDFSAMDRWMKLWPDSRYYLVFACVGDEFAGQKIGTEAFHQRVGDWAGKIDAHLKEIGVKPGQLALLLVDEPYRDAQDEIIAAWARAIKESAPDIGIFADPVWERPDLTKNQDALLKADIVSPNLHTFCIGPREGRDYYARLRSRGKALWFYQCDGPVKLLCPDRYFRLQAWYAFKHGASGMGFWSFGDTGGCLSSWNEYSCSGASYTPVFLSPNGATDGIHWQAVREGIEDYEYMAMLCDAAAKSPDQAFKDKAAKLLEEIGEKVTPGHKTPYRWADNAERSLADFYRLEILSLLESAKPR